MAWARTSAPLWLLPARAASVCSKTSFPSVWTHDHARRVLAAARHADRILGPLDTTHPWPLVRRLDDFSRQHRGRGRGTLHLEARPIEGRLDGHLLFVIQKLALADATRDRQDCHKRRAYGVWLEHESPPFLRKQEGCREVQAPVRATFIANGYLAAPGRAAEAAMALRSETRVDA